MKPAGSIFAWSSIPQFFAGGLIIALAIEVRRLRQSLASLQKTTKQVSNMVDRMPQMVTIRIPPGKDLAQELEALVVRLRWRAATIVSCVGSLSAATLRLANASSSDPAPGNEVKARAEKFEIVSLTGTLEYSPELNDKGVAGMVTRHLHVALADKNGNTWGGHIISNSDERLGSPAAPRLPVYTTAEVCLVHHPDVIFTRKHCSLSGWPELAIEGRSVF